MTIEIVKALDSHADDIRSLYYIPANHEAPRLQESLRDYPGFVALEDGCLIGFCISFRFAPDILELANIYVHPDYRHQGIGSKLLAHLEREAAALNYRAIILVNSDLYENKQPGDFADSFYQKNNYVQSFDTGHTKVFYKSFDV